MGSGIPLTKAADEAIKCQIFIRISIEFLIDKEN